MLQADVVKDDYQLVNEQINSTFIAQCPFGIWRIELNEPLEISLSPDVQVRHILAHGHLVEHNRAFDKLAAVAEKKVDEGFLFGKNGELLVDFVNSNYKLTERNIETVRADGLPQAFRGDVFGVLENGKLLQIWGTLRKGDAEQRNRLFIQDTLDSLSEHIAVLDADGEIVAVNQSWTRFASQNGFEESVSCVGIGANYLEICRAASGENAAQAQTVCHGIGEVLAGKSGNFTIEYPCHSPSENRWFLLIATPLKTGGGAVVSHFDITPRKLMEQEREEIFIKMHTAYSEAEAANKIKDEFLGTISHELRTPLTSIVGWAQMLLNENLDAAMVRQGLETINRSANKQTHLIEDLLDVSRIIRGKLEIEPQALNPATSVAAAIESIKPTAVLKQIIIRNLADDDTAPIYADPRRVSQILSNLLANAVKFTPKNGQIEVGLRNLVSSVEFTVRDTGIGIKSEILPNIFDRFRQADGKITRRFGGLGLGLAVVRHLVEMHGGTVQAASEGENLGSIFTVTLPAMNLQTVSAAPNEIAVDENKTAVKQQRSEVNKLNGVKLLIVEDDRDNLEWLKLLFDTFGAEVETAASAAEALEKYVPFAPDLVISDIGMPDEDGYSLIKKIRQINIQQGWRKPAIALTAFAKNEDTARALDAGFQRHIKKPVEPNELVANVSELLKSWDT